MWALCELFFVRGGVDGEVFAFGKCSSPALLHTGDAQPTKDAEEIFFNDPS